ncbi:unnamed protein product (macronuclear) [Paramecium tetraurelia]|uniref:Uncharacterized protein n=1 Tax=Paramecium tetraurelia TaxID=5888 RepID=A0BUX2_PARTE|nr:uncharacterized protein GSPATT00005585001 [Paramecium tetraurelia]CAK62339.1 unnamed protein product [Paramecium tetraurelia]|eukprot:XP_001429737.1 hypothetical protein (macronuclear) [Paramecium tetraurelia strain d4-2]
MMCFQYNGGKTRCHHGTVEHLVDGKWVKQDKKNKQIKQVIREIDEDQNQQQFKIQNQGQQQQKPIQPDQQEKPEDLQQNNQPQLNKDSS